MNNLLRAVVIGSAVFALYSQNAYAAGGCYNIKVTVDQSKLNGKDWDPPVLDGNMVHAAPDIVTTINHRRMRRCQDSFTCVYRRLYLEGTTVAISIVDKDVLFDDPIGFGECNVPSASCQIGSAKAQITPCR